MKKIKKWKVLVSVILLLVILRVLLFESVSIYGYLEAYPNGEKYQEYILARPNYYVFNFALFGGEDWTRYQYLFMFQWEYNALIDEIREDLYEELDALVENYESVSGYEVDDKTMAVEIYYQKDIYDEYEEIEGTTWKDVAEGKIKSLCTLWCMIAYRKTPRDYETNIFMYNTFFDDSARSGKNGTGVTESSIFAEEERRDAE